MHTAPLGPIAPVSLNDKRKIRTILRAIAINLPEILIINMIIWVAALAAIFSFASMVPDKQVGLPIFAVLFGAPAGWATWQTVKLALTPQATQTPPAPSQEQA